MEQAGTTLCGYGNGSNGAMVRGGRTMAQLARVLGGFLGGNAIDRTGLEGTFDFTLTWAPNSQPGAVGPSLATLHESTRTHHEHSRRLESVPQRGGWTWDRRARTGPAVRNPDKSFLLTGQNQRRALLGANRRFTATS